MEASLDTNVIIHLYKANLQEILFCRFAKIKVYEFIRNHEMERHADSKIIASFDQDVKLGKIELITDEYLRSIGMYKVFQQHVKEWEILFGSKDLGEVYAISMARTLGCCVLVTDDIKEYGPHYTLMRMQDTDVIPLAFYEVLFLDYLEQKMTAKEVMYYFNAICSSSGMTMDCRSKLKTFKRRFWDSPYRDSEKDWMESLSRCRGIDSRTMIQELLDFLELQCG